MLSSEQWFELSAHNSTTGNFYRLALELATEATQLLGGERVSEYESVLQERMRKIDDLMHVMPPEEAEPVPPDAAQLAKAAVHALLVRDTYGFNAGAFGELFRPFRGIVNIAELERAASRVLAPANDPNAPAKGNAP
jgi:hypothetical protein